MCVGNDSIYQGNNKNQKKILRVHENKSCKNRAIKYLQRFNHQFFSLTYFSFSVLLGKKIQRKIFNKYSKLKSGNIFFISLILYFHFSIFYEKKNSVVMMIIHHLVKKWFEKEKILPAAK